MRIFQSLVLLILVLAGSALPGPVAAAGVPSKATVMEALRAQDFDRLEALYQAEESAGVPLLRGFFAFRHSDPENLDKLSNWVLQRPQSYVARLARGVHLRHLARLSRSYGSPARTRSYFSRAVADFSAALRLEPKLEIAFAYMISVAFEMGRPGEAEQIRRLGLQEVPVAPLIHATYLLELDPAEGGQSQEDFEAYLDSLRVLHGDDPRFAYIDGYRESSKAAQKYQMRSEAGEALYESVLIPEALSQIDEAIRQQPTAWRYHKRARIHVLRKDYDLALADIEAGLNLDPETPWIVALQLEADAPHLNMLKADVLWRLGRLEEAQQAFDHAIDLDPFHPKRLRTRANFHRWASREKGRAGDVQGYIDHRNARLDDLDNASFLAHESAALQRELGQHRLSQFSASIAKYHYERATDLSPRSADSWLGLARSLYFQGDCWAVDAIKRYIELCRAKGDCAMTNSLPSHIRENMRWCQSMAEAKPEDWRSFVLPDWIHSQALCGRRFRDTLSDIALQECLDKAKAGDPRAQYDIGVLLFRGTLGGLRNFEKSVEWLERSADQGYANAQAALGEKYVFGLGVPQDKEKGRRLLDQAVRENSVEGYFRLGALLYSGRHLPEDKAQGRKLIAKAAEQGHIFAERALSNLPDG